MKYLLMLLFAVTAKADDIGVVEAKGMFFKDQIRIVGFDDPSIAGVTCYTTNYVYTMTLKDDSSNSSLACRRTGPLKGEFKEQRNVFAQSKTFMSLSNKETVVDRFWDSKRRVLVYLSYTKSWGEKNTQHSISVVPVDL